MTEKNKKEISEELERKWQEEAEKSSELNNQEILKQIKYSFTDQVLRKIGFEAGYVIARRASQIEQYELFLVQEKEISTLMNQLKDRDEEILKLKSANESLTSSNNSLTE